MKIPLMMVNFQYNSCCFANPLFNFNYLDVIDTTQRETSTHSSTSSNITTPSLVQSTQIIQSTNHPQPNSLSQTSHQTTTQQTEQNQPIQSTQSPLQVQNQHDSNESDNNDSENDGFLEEWDSAEDSEKETKKRSFVWQHFVKKKFKHKTKNIKSKYVFCQVKKGDNDKICGKKYKYSSSTNKMKQHLEQEHRLFKDESTKDNENVDISFLLLMFIISAALPFQCVNNNFFIRFCKALNPEYKVPDRKTLSNMASKYHSEKKNKLKEALKKVKFINLTFDGWTSRQNYNYIGLTAHYFDDALKLVSKCLAIKTLLGGHSANNITTKVREILIEYGILDKIGFVSTDNVNSMVKAVKDLGFFRVGCMGHILDLILKNSVNLMKKTGTINEDVTFETDEETDDIQVIKKSKELIALEKIYEKHTNELKIFASGM